MNDEQSFPKLKWRGFSKNLKSGLFSYFGQTRHVAFSAVVV